MNWHIIEPVINLDVRKLCLHKYQNHPKGCPNFNKKIGCPPQTPIIDKLIDLSKPVWAVWNIFDFKSHCDRMKQKHPDWSKRQVECCLYWQPKARKQLKQIIYNFLVWHPHKLFIVKNPEGAGVNLTETMKSIGHNLEWPPINITYQIVLGGYKNAS